MASYTAGALKSHLSAEFISAETPVISGRRRKIMCNSASSLGYKGSALPIGHDLKAATCKVQHVAGAREILCASPVISSKTFGAVL